MKRGPTGTLRVGPTLGGEVVRAFDPSPLPPEPALAIDAALREEIDLALLALGRLDSVSNLLPDTTLFLYTFVRKEAVLSSQIEGTQAALGNLVSAGIVRELTGRQRGKVFGYRRYLGMLEEGTTAPPG